MPAQKKGPSKRGTKKKGVPNHCSMDPVSLNAKEMQFCKVFVATGRSFHETARALGINWMTAKSWSDKPKIKRECDVIQRKLGEEFAQRSAEEIAADAHYYDFVGTRVALAAAHAPPHPKRGEQDRLGGAKILIAKAERMLGYVGKAVNVSVNLQNNNALVVNPAVGRLQSQQVYLPKELREQYGITNSRSDAVDAHFAAIDEQRKSALASRTRIGADTPPMGT